jgi:High-affinity Fe2+/Pb2+ permease
MDRYLLRRKLKEILLFIAAASALSFFMVAAAHGIYPALADTAAEAPNENNDETWTRYVDVVNERLANAVTEYNNENHIAAAQILNSVYEDNYRDSGFRAQIAADLTEERAAFFDEKFAAALEAVNAAEDAGSVKNKIGIIKTELRSDALKLDALHPKTTRNVTGYKTWAEVASAMNALLDESYSAYTAGDNETAFDKVDEVYFKFYEKLGFEKSTMAYISGARASSVEYKFTDIKREIKAGSEKAAVKKLIDELKTMLAEDAEKLDGGSATAFGVFSASLGIIVREGAEAILIVGAILAYLKKSGNGQKVKSVYIGSGAAILASVIMALIFMLVTTLSGANQELIEGITMLLAVSVLFYVSNWIFSKSEAKAWEGYIKKKVDASVKKGSALSLAFAAFLAVFREGAEIILFYQALLAGSAGFTAMIWLGLGVGIVLLAVIFLLIRFLSVKIPLKPFFIATSALMFIMSISFLGNGIKELQEGNYATVTPIRGMGSVDFFGIYPTLETFIPQLALIAVTAGSIIYQILRWKKLKAAGEKSEAAAEGANIAAGENADAAPIPREGEQTAEPK